MSRCDLHIHSRFSARSEEWLFRRFDLPDSYSDPHELHRLLRERGMDFVTITDHDTIEGVLRIADQPHVFLSEEVTTYFPHDPCKIHLLVWGITEGQHDEITQLRENISPTLAAAASVLIVASVLLLTAVEILRRRTERLRGLAPR